MELIELQFSQFLKRHPVEKPFLLGLSGGSDSILLFHLLVQFEIPFFVAHVNHGWREESNQEGKLLQKLCQENDIVFHERKLNKSQTNRNLEDVARKERHAFFEEIFQTNECCGVMLGHHADDFAEVVLKRLFEGANLVHIGGLSEKIHFNGIPFFRPLLELQKKEIRGYLNEKKIPFFEDATNYDSKFLRARFRKEIFPMLSEIFGKEITPSLCRIGKHSAELQEFLQEFCTPFRSMVQRKGDQISLNLENHLFKTKFEWKTVVRDFFENEGMTLTSNTLESVVFHLRKKSCAKELVIGSKRVKIDRGNLILFV